MSAQDTPILGYSRWSKLINWCANLNEETTGWRAGRVKTAHRVRGNGDGDSRFLRLCLPLDGPLDGIKGEPNHC